MKESSDIHIDSNSKESNNYRTSSVTEDDEESNQRGNLKTEDDLVRKISLKSGALRSSKHGGGEDTARDNVRQED